MHLPTLQFREYGLHAPPHTTVQGLSVAVNYCLCTYNPHPVIVNCVDNGQPRSITTLAVIVAVIDKHLQFLTSNKNESAHMIHVGISAESNGVRTYLLACDLHYSGISIIGSLYVTATSLKRSPLGSTLTVATG